MVAVSVCKGATELLACHSMSLRWLLVSSAISSVSKSVRGARTVQMRDDTQCISYALIIHEEDASSRRSAPSMNATLSGEAMLATEQRLLLLSVAIGWPHTTGIME